MFLTSPLWEDIVMLIVMSQLDYVKPIQIEDFDTDDNDNIVFKIYMIKIKICSANNI